MSYIRAQDHLLNSIPNHFDSNGQQIVDAQNYNQSDAYSQNTAITYKSILQTQDIKDVSNKDQEYQMDPAIHDNSKSLQEQPEIYLMKIRSLQDEVAVDEVAVDEDCELVIVDGEEQCLRPVQELSSDSENARIYEQSICDSQDQKENPNCQTQVGETSAGIGSLNILIIFGGVVVLLIIIYMILALRRHLQEGKKHELQKAQVDGLNQDYDQFKKIKLMELQALEKQKFQSKTKSSKTSSKKSKKSSSSSGKYDDIENTKHKSMITETHINDFHNLQVVIEGEKAPIDESLEINQITPQINKTKI